MKAYLFTGSTATYRFYTHHVQTPPPRSIGPGDLIDLDREYRFVSKVDNVAIYAAFAVDPSNLERMVLMVQRQEAKLKD